MKQGIIIVLSFLFVSFSSHAQLGGTGLGVGGGGNPVADRKPKVDWTLEVSSQQLTVGDTISIKLIGTIEKDWYIYSNDFDPNLGPNLAEITFKPSGYKLLGKTKAISAKSHYEEIWGGTVRTFEKKAEFVQKIIITSTKVNLNVSVLYQACSTINGMCLPPEEYINETSLIAKPNTAATPAVSPDTSSQANIDTVAKAPVKSPPSATANTIFQPAPEAWCPDAGAGKDEESLWGFMVLAFLSGLLALITPCVFPMVPMTVTFFTRSSEQGKKGRRDAIIYGISIIVIYAIFALPLTIINGPEFANLLSTHWLPNLFFFLIFVFFGISFLGYFDITLPNSVVNKMDQHSEKGGLIGIFFMAFTIALVSFSCTGPIVGTILVEAAGGSKLKPIVGMISYATAFSIPFTLFALFPQWLNKLPKSGRWLNTVKVTMGFVELALALKFLSIADQVYHWELLSRDRYLIIWIVFSTLLAVFYLGYLPLPGNKRGFDKKHAWMSVFAIALGIWLGTGLINNPLKSLSGYLPPPAATHIDHAKFAADFKAGKASPICDVPKYKNLLHLPLGLVGYFEYQQALACAKAQGKPLFIDFTGHGCVNCREMENYVWSDYRVLKQLKNDFVVLALYVDERTYLDKEEWITTPEGKVKDQIGEFNAYLELVKFGEQSQPYYVILDPYTERPLVTPIGYNNKNVDHFVDFLERAKNCFKEHVK